ncbi:CLUMA_CG018719, isoform A [Clunio marinus]|uniref:CLUMA_CG018719, isoform A n=1 Tax=Clunio marinus TaxID=568069 RepID=A0A1J1IZW8_9DIPT|nr:CLUMA_CG018719, isoform A [Clunio marinus]
MKLSLKESQESSSGGNNNKKINFLYSSPHSFIQLRNASNFNDRSILDRRTKKFRLPILCLLILPKATIGMHDDSVFVKFENYTVDVYKDKLALNKFYFGDQ